MGCRRTLSVAIFIHSSKFELMTSRGTLMIGACATERSCCFVLECAVAPAGASAALCSAVAPSEEGPASLGSESCTAMATFADLRRRRFSAISSFILTDCSGVRPGSEVKLSSCSGA